MIRTLDTRDAWLAYRAEQGRHRVSSTEVAKILNISPFGGPWSVWAEHHNVLERTWSASQLADLERGRKWERRVVEDYAEAVGIPVPPEIPWTVVVNDAVPWAITSPDRLVCDGFDAVGPWPRIIGGVEAKTARYAGAWGESGTVIERWTDGSELIVPPYYATQVYWSLACTGADWWDIAVSIPRPNEFPELRWYRLLRDPATQDELVAAVGAWRERHLVGGEEPTIDASEECRRSILARHPIAKTGKREATPDELSAIIRLANANKAQAAAKAEAERATNELAAMIGDASGLTIGTGKGAPSLTWVRVAGRKTLDTDRLLAERPDLRPVLDAYQKIGRPSAFPRLNNLE